jgi:hypothetical protein
MLYNEIINVISCNHKETNEEIKKIHYEINSLIFDRLKHRITDNSNKYLQAKLIQKGIELNNLKLTEKFIPKQQEILEKLRKILHLLKKNYPLNEDYSGESEQKYLVYFYLKEKSGITIDKVFNYLLKIKELEEEYQPKVLVKSLQKTKEELLQFVNQYFTK